MKKLFDIAEKLKKQSIYVGSDLKYPDFEILLFIDSDDPGSRPDFIHELYQVLIKNEAQQSTAFARDHHYEELQTWIGKEHPNLLIPLNWLKIAIENYPYRLIIAIDPHKPAREGGWRDHKGRSPLDEDFWYQKKSSNNNLLLRELRQGMNAGKNDAESSSEWFHSRFLYNRICWVKKDEVYRICFEYPSLSDHYPHAFEGAVDQAGRPLCMESYLKLWLYLKWLFHLARRVRRIKDPHLIANFYNLTSTSEDEKRNSPYFSDTLPQILRDSEPNLKKGIFIFDLDKCVLNLSQSHPGALSHPTILFRRHANAFRYYDQQQKWEPEYGDSDHVFYGESLSGGLSYWTTFVDALSGPNSERAIRFILSLMEQALMRIYLVDERIQDWYHTLPKEVAGYLIQQRLFVSYLEAPLKYDQKKEPPHALYAQVKVSRYGLDSHFSNEAYFSMITANRRIDRKIDLLILHQGILDKWKSNPAETLKGLLYWKESVPFWVITSGRGTPTNLPQGIKFLPFSAVEACINGIHFEKLPLVRQIYSLKRDGQP